MSQKDVVEIRDIIKEHVSEGTGRMDSIEKQQQALLVSMSAQEGKLDIVTSFITNHMSVIPRAVGEIQGRQSLLLIAIGIIGAGLFSLIARIWIGI